MKGLSLSFKIAAVFIGTVVGAGLASGQEIVQFFTYYGFKGTIGILICGVLYIITGIMTMDLAYKYNTASYHDLITLSCGKYLGWVVDLLTTFFLFGGACIILAGSGSIFEEHLGLPFFIGVIVMMAVTAAVVFYSTDGLIFINSIIVPCMITITLIICISVFWHKSEASFWMWYDITNAPVYKGNWLWSSLLYMAFNMLCATGVLAPMTRDIKRSRHVFLGVVLGSVGLLLLTLIIDVALLLNVPNIFNYSIPMLYLSKYTVKIAGSALSVVIWLEMFSTEVSDVYSLAKKMQQSFKIDYRLSVILVLLLAFPFTRLGFANLIKLLYPPFGVVSLIYIIGLIRLYCKLKLRPDLHIQ